jgi:hypothetical protein
MVAENVNFGKCPSAVSVGRDLNMTDKEGKRLYYPGTSRFAAKSKLLDLSSGQFLTYMEQLGDRATEYGQKRMFQEY